MPLARPPRVALPRSLLLFCFFGSGLTGLVYELAWTQRLQLVFGSTIYSITTVLAAFMAGLGLGSYLIGRRVDREPSQGFRTYALLELGVSIFALLSLPLLAGVEKVYALLQGWLALNQGGATLLKFALAFPVLAFPAGMMGGTLPALVRAISRHRSSVHRTVGWLYGVNTVGAATGTVLTGMLLIEILGLWRTVLLAATVNLAIGLVVLNRLKRLEKNIDEEAPADAVAPSETHQTRLRDHLRRPAVRFCAISVVLTGMLSMSYEVVWTRLLSLVIGSSSYAFTLVLGVFLLGIAGGSLIFFRASRGRQPTAFGLALILLALALWVAITITMIPQLPHWMMTIAQVPGISFGRILVAEVLFAVGLLLLPTLLLGAALPMAMGIIARELGQVGRDVGGVYLANTLGAIAGTVLTGFLMVPLWGTRNTLLIGLLANLLVAGYGVFTFAARRRVVGLLLAGAVGALALSQPPWPAVTFDSGVAYRLGNLNADSPLAFERALRRSPNKRLFFHEGANATISARQFRDGVTLLLNGKPDASTSADMATQAVLGLVAMLAHPQPRSVNIVGWGSGVTAYVSTFFPTVKRVDVVEIEPAVVAAAPFFSRVNGNVQEDPRVRLHYDDARSFYLTSKDRYDVVISEPSNPWMAGVDALFSAEYHALVRQRLAPGGVFAQWLQLYRLDAQSIALVLRTALSSFKDVQLWFSDPYDVVILASDRPLVFDVERLRRVYAADSRIPLHMEAYGPGSAPAQLFGCFLLDRRALQAIVDRYPKEILADDRPVLGYRAVRRLYSPTHIHLESIVSLKVARRLFLPPLRGKTLPKVGAPLSGVLRLIRSQSALADSLSRWAHRRWPRDPALRLSRAKALVRIKRYQAAIVLVPDDALAPLSWRGEASLLRGRALLKSGRPRSALEQFGKMGAYRPVARAIYALRALLKKGDHAGAWRMVGALLERTDDRRDADALQLGRHLLYSRELHELASSSGQWRRVVELLSKRKESAGGEYDRLLLLYDAYRALGRPIEAAKMLDQLFAFSPYSAKLFESCEEVYRAAGREVDRRRCRRQREHFMRKPRAVPLWSRPPRSR